MTTVDSNVDINRALQENENENTPTSENDFNNKTSEVEIQGMVEDDYIDCLDAETQDEDEKDRPRRRSWDRSRGRERRLSRELEKDRDRDSIRNRRRSRSFDKRRSRSNDKRRSRSNEKRRSRSNDKRRSRSNDRRRSRSNDRRRSRSNDRRRSRSNDRRKSRSNDRRRSRSIDRKRSRSIERKKEASRRDPSKSNKDIEQDKIRTKKDNDNKILAEKEKAIKTLLDSDNVVPPGTEGEAIQDLVDKNQQQKQDEEGSKRNGRDIRKNSRERRRTPSIRSRLGVRRYSPRRSPARSPIRRRTPITFSPDRRRRSPDDRRRRSLDRENSAERREASRRRLRDRVVKEKRSRSRDRRSLDRRRSRSLDRHRRASRSPFDRHSPRRRRRSLSRSPLRSPSRFRKRSPFLRELARQFQDDSFRQDNINPIEPVQIDQMRDMETGGPSYMPPESSSGMHQGGMLVGQELLMMPNELVMMQSGCVMPLGPMEMGPMPMCLPRGCQNMPEPPVAGPPYMNYEGCPSGPSGLNYEPNNLGPLPPYYSSDPVMYNQGNPMPPMNPACQSRRSPTPQPVPAPRQGPVGPMMYQNSVVPPAHQPLAVPGPMYSPNDVYNSVPTSGDLRNRLTREDRMKTPEPPIISDAKQSEKTSLSSLLEASVSSKDQPGLNGPLQGFRQEIIRKCERALRRIPAEDPRLKMKGRFFFDPSKKITIKDKKGTASNSILLQKGRTEIHWDEEENQLSASSQPEPQQPIIRKRITHQKICQTDEPARESTGTQIELQTADFGVQVDLQVDRRELMDDRRASMEDRRGPMDDRRGPMDDRRAPMDDRRAPIEDRRIVEDNRRPLSDRLDWSMRETYDHAPNMRDNEDLRWSLSKSGSSSRDRPSYTVNQWNRGFSPNRQAMPNDHVYRSGMPMDNMPRSALDHLMEVRERGIDPRERMVDRETELRERELGMREMRSMDMMRERDRMMDKRDGMIMSGDGGMREPIMNDSFSRQLIPIDDYGMRNNSFGRGIERDRGEMPLPRRDSPVPLEDDPEELEIIEERGFDIEPTWQRGSGSLISQFSNIRGTARGSATPPNRSFRGRVASFRTRN